MFFDRLLIVCALTVFASSAFAEEWEEVFSDKNSTGAKFYFDKNIARIGAHAVRTQYMIQETSARPVSKSKPDGPSYDKAIYKAVIDCNNYGWKFLHRAYYLNDKVQFEEDTTGGPTPAPPAGTAPSKIGEKACASRR